MPAACFYGAMAVDLAVLLNGGMDFGEAVQHIVNLPDLGDIPPVDDFFGQRDQQFANGDVTVKQAALRIADQINRDITDGVQGRFLMEGDFIKSSDGISRGKIVAVDVADMSFLARVRLTASRDMEYLWYFANGRAFPWQTALACSYMIMDHDPLPLDAYDIDDMDG